MNEGGEATNSSNLLIVNINININIDIVVVMVCCLLGRKMECVVKLLDSFRFVRQYQNFAFIILRSTCTSTRVRSNTSTRSARNLLTGKSADRESVTKENSEA